MSSQTDPEKVAVINDANTFASKPLQMSQDLSIKRTRRIFLIIIGILFVLSVMGLTANILIVGDNYPRVTNQQMIPLGQSLVAVLIYGFGMLVAYRYSSRGLRIFGYIGIVCITVTINVIIVILVISTLNLTNVSLVDKKRTPSVLRQSIIGFFTLVIMVLIVRMAFKLAWLMDTKGHSGPEEI